MTKSPRVTVLMSAYNAESFIAEAVDSVLGQTFSDFEFLVFEDKSTDATREILESYTDSRILLVKNEVNLGLTRNLFTGMNMARGEYVARMDADDICMPERFECQVEYMEKFSNVGVLGSAVMFFDDRGGRFVAYQPLAHDEIMCHLLFGFTMLHPSVMIRKSKFVAHNLNYDTNFIYSQDHELWARAIRKMEFANLREPLLMMREHDEKIGKRRRALQEDFTNLVRKRQFEELGIKILPEYIELFNNIPSKPSAYTVESLKTYEDILLEIFNNNNRSSVYDQKILQSLGAENFRKICNSMLSMHKHDGLYYWKSKLRKYDSSIDVLISLKLIVRSAIVIIFGNKNYDKN